MKEMGIQGRIKRKYITTTNSKHNNKIYSNLIKDKELTGINQVWCADITYIRIFNGFVYLAAIIDIYSRKIVGYAIGKTLSSKLAITALNMAIATRKTNNLIHHSDQGIQYTSKDYIKILKDNGIRISMSAKGNPYDNAFAESFFKTLKQEEVYLWEYKTFSDVVERIPYFILDVYNKKRLHSSLGYRPPEEYEEVIGKERLSGMHGVLRLKVSNLRGSLHIQSFALYREETVSGETTTSLLMRLTRSGNRF